jgi:hypothetical protein
VVETPVRPYPVETKVPRLIKLRAEASRKTLVVHGELLGREAGIRPFYDPIHEGGWMLQLFVNTDQSDTGYWLGYDYIVRGGEWSPVQGTMVTRRITLEDQYPGGWGPESGVATFTLHGHELDIVVPLESLGGDDGNVDFALETYATVSCPECVGGFSQVFAADYFGTSSRSRGPVVFTPGHSSAATLGMRWTPRPRHSASADPAGGLAGRIRPTAPRSPAH